MKLAIRAASAAILLGLASTAVATPVEYRYSLLVTDSFAGPVSPGDRFFGRFLLEGDNLTETGFERFAPAGTSDPTVTGTLLDFSVSILGRSFTLSDDFSFPDLPAIELFDGIATGFDFVSFDTALVLGTGNGPSLDFSYLDFLVGENRETVDVAGRIVDVEQVPEPSTLLLMAGALLGLASRRPTPARA